jgi:hypothetical protein
LSQDNDDTEACGVRIAKPETCAEQQCLGEDKKPSKETVKILPLKMILNGEEDTGPNAGKKAPFHEHHILH